MGAVGRLGKHPRNRRPLGGNPSGTGKAIAGLPTTFDEHSCRAAQGGRTLTVGCRSTRLRRRPSSSAVPCLSAGGCPGAWHPGRGGHPHLAGGSCTSGGDVPLCPFRAGDGLGPNVAVATMHWTVTPGVLIAGLDIGGLPRRGTPSLRRLPALTPTHPGWRHFAAHPLQDRLRLARTCLASHSKDSKVSRETPVRPRTGRGAVQRVSQSGGRIPKNVTSILHWVPRETPAVFPGEPPYAMPSGEARGPLQKDGGRSKSASKPSLSADSSNLDRSAGAAGAGLGDGGGATEATKKASLGAGGPQRTRGKNGVGCVRPAGTGSPAASPREICRPSTVLLAGLGR